MNILSRSYGACPSFLAEAFASLVYHVHGRCHEFCGHTLGKPRPFEGVFEFFGSLCAGILLHRSETHRNLINHCCISLSRASKFISEPRFRKSCLSDSCVICHRGASPHRPSAGIVFRAHPQIPWPDQVGSSYPELWRLRSRENLSRTAPSVGCSQLVIVLGHSLCEILQSCIVGIRPGRAFTNISLLKA